MTKLAINVEKGDLDFVQFRQETYHYLNINYQFHVGTSTRSGRKERA